jgi:hypothetical protein
MGYLAQMPVLQDAAASTLSKAPDFVKSIDSKKIVKYAAIAGAGILAFQSLKLLVYGKAAAAAYEKAKEIIR